MLHSGYLQGIVCPSPPEVAHGRVDRSREYAFDDLAEYSCESGYEFQSRSNIRCGHDGTWMGVDVVCQREFPWCLIFFFVITVRLC